MLFSLLVAKLEEVFNLFAFLAGFSVEVGVAEKFFFLSKINMTESRLRRKK